MVRDVVIVAVGLGVSKRGVRLEEASCESSRGGVMVGTSSVAASMVGRAGLTVWGGAVGVGVAFVVWASAAESPAGRWRTINNNKKMVNNNKEIDRRRRIRIESGLWQPISDTSKSRGVRQWQMMTRQQYSVYNK